MDLIFRRNEGISMDAWPCIDQDNYKRLGDEQGLFENQWC